MKRLKYTEDRILQIRMKKGRGKIGKVETATIIVLGALNYKASEIAEFLGVSETTICDHRRKIRNIAFENRIGEAIIDLFSEKIITVGLSKLEVPLFDGGGEHGEL